MELVNILIDTNIALYFLTGDKKLTNLLDNAIIYLSFISELELLSYPELDNKEQESINNFIQECVVVDINPPIKQKTITIWQQSNIKLPDTIIAATAISKQLPFLSADKDFAQVHDLQLFSYEL
ncbi:hypothetical protein LX73_1123 [Fodinibius salinus]|uniref:PIN domain-containing protein n=1 Tax=Fodinibius salinus TaxID=860790 RepID=A0A5D3YMQ1_9BACT|nr:type II toxin-antitoxin system VapC family toxin [Fodinibius salinus]TYP93419.1 hypothetical protein LX73_1123 [Fodinibius salinus]